jgi:hypothetical protein
MTRPDIIGTGWAFPPGVDARGRIALVQGEVDIDQAIRTIILTPIGQRVMRPHFGCRIHELLFHPNNASTFTLARHYVLEALAFWEPRIRVESVEVSVDPEQHERMWVNIRYEVKSTYDKRALVVPFYRIPHEP